MEKSTGNSNRIYCFTLSGVYQASFASCEEASRVTRVPVERIRRALISNGRRAGRYTWTFLKTNTSNRYSKPVRSIDSQGVSRIHKSIRAAAEYHNLTRATLSKHLRGVYGKGKDGTRQDANTRVTVGTVCFEYWHPEEHKENIKGKIQKRRVVAKRTKSSQDPDLESEEISLLLSLRDSLIRSPRVRDERRVGNTGDSGVKDQEHRQASLVPQCMAMDLLQVPLFLVPISPPDHVREEIPKTPETAEPPVFDMNEYLRNVPHYRLIRPSSW